MSGHDKVPHHEKNIPQHDKSVPHAAHAAHAPQTSFGKNVMRFSFVFVFICAVIPFLTLLREKKQRGDDAVTVWWLKSVSSEDKWLEESDRENDGESGVAGRIISKWAAQQREVARLYSNNFGKGYSLSLS